MATNYSAATAGWPRALTVLFKTKEDTDSAYEWLLNNWYNNYWKATTGVHGGDDSPEIRSIHLSLDSVTAGWRHRCSLGFELLQLLL